MSCAAPEQTSALPVGTDVGDQSVVQGRVLNGSDPVGGAFVRLLDSTGEFTAEVVTSEGGDFRFYAAPGSWTVRALSRAGHGQASGDVRQGVNQLDIVLA